MSGNCQAAISKTNPGSLPAAVAGPKLEPYVPYKNLVSNITDLGFKKVIDPIVNGLAREPLYMIHVADAYERLVPQIAKGWLAEDQALRIAQTQASYAMLPQIHNTALRNQFAQLARNFLPFYFAQEQALKRAFNALKDTSIASPLFSRGMRFYQLAEHAMSDPTFMSTDENGNKYQKINPYSAFGAGLDDAVDKLGLQLERLVGNENEVKDRLQKNFVDEVKAVLPEHIKPGQVDIWFQDESRIGQQGSLTRVWHEKGKGFALSANHDAKVWRGGLWRERKCCRWRRMRK